jgi:hypothetical protein
MVNVVTAVFRPQWLGYHSLHLWHYDPAVSLLRLLLPTAKIRQASGSLILKLKEPWCPITGFTFEQRFIREPLSFGFVG